jgi:hypothetical protein
LEKLIRWHFSHVQKATCNFRVIGKRLYSG